jgi:hypothetical protein
MSEKSIAPALAFVEIEAKFICVHLRFLCLCGLRGEFFSDSSPEDVLEATGGFNRN